MSKIKTTGDLRAFLANSIEGVSNGTLESEKARNITKLAAQINESFYAEIKIAKIQHDLGREASVLGNLSVGNVD